MSSRRTCFAILPEPSDEGMFNVLFFDSINTLCLDFSVHCVVIPTVVTLEITIVMVVAL